jgi:hypothetical protein
MRETNQITRKNWTEIESKQQNKKLVTLVINAKISKIPDAEIVQQLVLCGISEKDTSYLISSVVAGFQAGVNAVITAGTSAEGYIPGENPFYDLAFREGKATLRFTTPFWILAKYLLPLLIGITMVGIVVMLT